MIIKNLRLHNFRNYEKTEIVLDPGMNLITGDNAQGKTNLLESMVCLSLTRSHRLNSDQSLIRNGTDYAEIGCIFEDGTDKRIDILIHPEGKTLLVRKQPVKRNSEFIGLLNVILFSPDDMGIFSDAPKERRKILNQEITKVSPQYLTALSKYNALLKDRNILLKQEEPDVRYLDVLDEQMIEVSRIIIDERRKFVSEINKHMPDIFQRLSGTDLKGTIRYHSVIDDESNDIENDLRMLYMNLRLRDLEYHVTGNGIHREDIEFDLNDQNVIYTASQGQKRMILLAFKLSLMKFAEIKSGKIPVLLLDDVLSELDMTRQKRLIREIYGKCQSIITSTEYPEFLKDYQIREFRITNGTVTEYNGGK